MESRLSEEVLRKLEGSVKRAEEDVLFDQAKDLYLATREAGAEGLLQLYQQAFNLFHDLYKRDPDSERGEQCLWGVKTLSHDLWRLDREHFPIDLAIDFAKELVRRNLDSAKEWDNLSLLYQNAGAWPEAMEAAKQALLRDPAHSQAWRSLGCSFLALGDVPKGRGCYETAVRLDPDAEAPQSEWDFTAWFILGDYRTGWRGWTRLNERTLEERSRLCPVPLRPLVGRPRWNGEPIRGRLLLHVENGHGDAFMVLRWVPRVLERVGALRLRVRPQLVPLLAGQWEGVEVVTWQDDPGEFECCTLSFSLPTLFGVEHQQDVSSPPYLRALKPFRLLEGAFRVGLRWAGDRAHTDDLQRSTSLVDWAPVLAVPGVTFYSLQLDTACHELQECGVPIHDLAPELTDWERTAAAMEQLDLIITVDTSVAHLAGALGRPVWICLPAAPEWRWMLERSDTPWYGSARLFRQPTVHDWGSVFSAVAAALRELVEWRAVEAA
jgi:tetratricopeptide (TPR) repeat protein